MGVAPKALCNKAAPLSDAVHVVSKLSQFLPWKDIKRVLPIFMKIIRAGGNHMETPTSAATTLEKMRQSQPKLSILWSLKLVCDSSE